MKVQGISRSTLPVTVRHHTYQDSIEPDKFFQSWIMPYGARWAFLSGVFVLFMQ